MSVVLLELHHYEHLRAGKETAQYGSQWAPPIQVSRETLEGIQVGYSLQHMFEELPMWDP